MLLTLVLFVIEAGVFLASVNLTLISQKSNYLGEQTPEYLDEIYDLNAAVPAGSAKGLRRAKNFAGARHNAVSATVLSSDAPQFSLATRGTIDKDEQLVPKFEFC